MASTYPRLSPAVGRARAGSAAAGASPSATPIAAPVTLSMMSVTSHARSMRATWSWVSSMPREYAASSAPARAGTSTQPARHRAKAQHQEQPGGHEQHRVEQLLPAAEDPEPVGRRAADVPAAAGRVLVGRDVARARSRAGIRVTIPITAMLHSRPNHANPATGPSRRPTASADHQRQEPRRGGERAASSSCRRSRTCRRGYGRARHRACEVTEGRGVGSRPDELRRRQCAHRRRGPRPARPGQRRPRRRPRAARRGRG